MNTATGIVDVADESGTRFRNVGQVASAVSSMRSEKVVRDVIDLAKITLNMTAPGILDGADLENRQRLMLVLVDYSLEVAPRAPEDENIIDVAALHDHVNYLRDTFGDVHTPPEFIEGIRWAAHQWINQEALEPRSDTDIPANEGREQIH